MLKVRKATKSRADFLSPRDTESEKWIITNYMAIWHIFKKTFIILLLSMPAGIDPTQAEG